MTEARLPTRDEIRELPRLARVGFAARCARRVQPLFEAKWPAAPEKHVKAVRLAVAAAERYAITGDATAAVRAYAAAARADAVATYAGDAARAAAEAAYAAADAYAAATYAARAAAAAAKAGWKPTVVPLIFQDFKLLFKQSRDEHWTDTTPAGPHVFGPMWPNGPPKGWPEAKPGERLVLTLGIPESATGEQVAEVFNDLYDAVNALHIAEGGPGLTLDQFKRLMTADVPVGEGV